MRAWVLIEVRPDEEHGVPEARRFAKILKRMLRAYGARCLDFENGDEVERLRDLVRSLADRCAGQSEVLARLAERPGGPQRLDAVERGPLPSGAADRAADAALDAAAGIPTP